MWTVIAASVAGSSHSRERNQDAYGYLPESGSGHQVRVVVADGHGAARYERSGKGARLAVEAALAEPLVSVSESSLQGAIRGCLMRWNEAVDKDLADNPHHSGRDAYGTTLIVVSADSTAVVCAQLGDGRILVVDARGKVSSPVPADSRLQGNLTTSLVSHEPMNDARFARLSADDVTLLMVCSDGYENSFADETALLRAASDFAGIVTAHGLGVVRKELRGWLSETMTAGSGDDTTVALLIRENG